MQNERTLNFIKAILIAIIIYISVSMTAYAFRYPEKTQTQILLEIHKALLWQ